MCVTLPVNDPEGVGDSEGVIEIDGECVCVGVGEHIAFIAESLIARNGTPDSVANAVQASDKKPDAKTDSVDITDAKTVPLPSTGTWLSVDETSGAYHFTSQLLEKANVKFVDREDREVSTGKWTEIQDTEAFKSTDTTTLCRRAELPVCNAPYAFCSSFSS